MSVHTICILKIVYALLYSNGSMQHVTLHIANTHKPHSPENCSKLPHTEFKTKQNKYCHLDPTLCTNGSHFSFKISQQKPTSILGCFFFHKLLPYAYQCDTEEKENSAQLSLRVFSHDTHPTVLSDRATLLREPPPTNYHTLPTLHLTVPSSSTEVHTVSEHLG